MLDVAGSVRLMRRYYGPELDEMAEAKGLIIEDFPLRGRLRAVKIGQVLYLDRRLSPPARRWWLAHLLAHHLLGVDRQLCLEGSEEPQEGEANRFVPHLLEGLPSFIVPDCKLIPFQPLKTCTNHS